MGKLMLLVLSLWVLAATSCGKKDNLAELINKQIDSLSHNMTLSANPLQLLRLKTNISDFTLKYPDDKQNAKYLFELARIHQSRGEYTEALTALDKLLKDYADSKEAGMSVFMQGFIYANLTMDLAKAKEKYELYLRKYAHENEKMAHDVKLELENLGKTPDEIFKEIQAKMDSAK